jgi:hypothetical protein
LSEDFEAKIEGKERCEVRGGRAAVVIGKRELSVVLLVFGAVISVYMALLANPTSAQNGGGTTSQSDEGCESLEVVDTFSGTENQITPQFDISGNTFRLRYEITDLDEDPGFGSFSIRPIGENGIGVGQSVLVFEEGSGSENILEGPGAFSLQIDSEGFEYTVTVEDCVGSEPTTLQPTTPQQSQNGSVTVNEPNNPEPTIINIPNKPLPPTGGLPVYGMVAGSIIAGAGLLGLGIGIRRGQRR